MGCDIHPYLEVVHNDKKNHQTDLPVVSCWLADISRDYYLFALMAGVRDFNDEIEHVSEPKGLAVIIASMKTIIKLSPGSVTPRLVFWFDN